MADWTLALEVAADRREGIDSLEETYLHNILEALPLGTLVDCCRGRVRTATQGWTGPYQIIGHSRRGLVKLRNLKTSKEITWFVGPECMRLSSLGDRE